MIQTINLHEFRDAFRKMERKESFSYDGLEILFDYLEQFEDDTGEKVELDVIALCCDFAEDSPESIASNYSVDIEGLEEHEIAFKVQEFLEEEGAFIGATDHGQFVYRRF